MDDAVRILAQHFHDAWRNRSAIALQDSDHVYIATVNDLRTARNWKRQRAVACKRTRQVERSYPWHPQGHEAKRLTGAARDARTAFIGEHLRLWKGEHYGDAVEALALVFGLSKNHVRKIGPSVRRFRCLRYGCGEFATHRDSYNDPVCREHVTETAE